MARPNKDELIRVRLTDEQKNLLQKAAEFRGIGLSTWLRMVGLQEARRVLGEDKLK